MIDADIRQAVYNLHQAGMGLREISRRMHFSVNTVAAIIKQKGLMPQVVRQDKITLDEQLLRELYKKCDGWVQRMHEILTEEHGLVIGYSTLTRLIRELELGAIPRQRCDHVLDQPGAEMQHDTTVYQLHIGPKPAKLVASILYYRYSKIRYLKFYRAFNRFAMKCFLHEALMFWGHAAPVCIIDNTNLARLSGSGKRAVMAPEMEHFGQKYGFKFQCHELNHADRKAGNERSFYTVESNFLPGRRFESLEDLNAQALHWATVRMPARPVAKSGLIPAAAFEYEKAYLQPVPVFVTPPYLEYERCIDQYGYISCNGNFYWIPGAGRHKVKVLQYPDKLKIYYQRELLREYDLPPDGVKNQKISPAGQPKSRYQPNNRKRPTGDEEQRLRSAAPEISAYLDFALKFTPGGKQRHGYIRRLYGVYQKLDPALFIQSVSRALTFRVTDIETIERIAVLQMQTGSYQIQSAAVDAQYKQRDAYCQGRFTDEVDLSSYTLPEDDHE